MNIKSNFIKKYTIKLMSYDKYISIINNYWFRGFFDLDRWFKKSTQYDSEIKTLFSGILKAAEQGHLEHWADTKDGFIAYIILLDQFTRQIYRYTGDSYKNDKKSLLFMKKHITKYINHLDATKLMFALMPLQHSEDIKDQVKGVKILKALIKYENDKKELNILNEALKHQEGHLKVIKMFGRFPKRNKYLPGRKTSLKEDEYIKVSSHLPY
tara:strand:- start:6510 stop:7145 length:636 start_codon:yes stop_codon:yes gene_type:complete